jgi:hypothetical protein
MGGFTAWTRRAVPWMSILAWSLNQHNPVQVDNAIQIHPCEFKQCVEFQKIA